jgi:hypothetical protein
MKAKRQGMLVSIKELKDLIKELDKENKEFEKQFKIGLSPNKQFIIAIVNKTPECSDTWEIEK